jgi:hypothetical protein
MNFIFSNDIPGSVQLKPILISGPDSTQFGVKEFLILERNGEAEGLFEIRYEYHCSPFKQAIIIDQILAVGFEEYFYMFDIIKKSNMLKLKMGGYFGHLYYNNEFFYITDSGGVFCIDKKGSLIWHNNNLAIDGVIINEFTDNKIFGSGECDPPGGWRDFILDRQTGLITKKKSRRSGTLKL